MIKTKRNSKRNSKRNNKRNSKRNTKNKNKTVRKYKKLSGGANGNVPPVESNTPTYIATLGSRGASNTQFNRPIGVAVSASDNRIYVADHSNHRVQIFDGNTRAYIATLGTTGSRGVTTGSRGASNTQFNNPSGVAVSATGDRIYVADNYNHRVQIFDGATLAYIATLGTTGSAGASNTQFYYPNGVAVSATGDRIYVVDTGNHRIQIFDGATRAYIATLGTTGSAGDSNTQFNGPRGVAVSATATGDRIYVADCWNHRVQIFDGNTRAYIATLGTTRSEGASNTQFKLPQGVAVSATGDRVYVVDYDNHRVQIFDGTTLAYIATLGTTGSEGASNTQFDRPEGVALSATGDKIYVVDSRNHRVQIFEPPHNVDQIMAATELLSIGSEDNPGLLPNIGHPYGLGLSKNVMQQIKSSLEAKIKQGQNST